MDKEKEILEYSNPKKVFKEFKKMFPQGEIQLSTRKDKKYMVRGDFTNDKWVHFGQMFYQDFTKHKDKERRRRFLVRNERWKDKPQNTPAYLSYYILW
jgi:hypothetical protein